MTLVEVSIAMVIAAIVMVAAYDVLSTASSRTAELDAKTTAQNEVRQALDAMAKDARQSSTGRADLSRVQVANADSFTFFSPDASQPTVRLRRIEYQVTAGSLRRRTTISTNAVDDPWAGRETWTWNPAGEWVEIVGDVASTTVFSYRDASGAATNDPQAVQSISIDLTVDPDGSAPPGPQTYAMTIDIRGPS